VAQWISAVSVAVLAVGQAAPAYAAARGDAVVGPAAGRRAGDQNFAVGQVWKKWGTQPWRTNHTRPNQPRRVR
jgi:hypothetical protein